MIVAICDMVCVAWFRGLIFGLDSLSLEGEREREGVPPN